MCVLGAGCFRGGVDAAADLLVKIPHHLESLKIYKETHIGPLHPTGRYNI